MAAKKTKRQQTGKENPEKQTPITNEPWINKTAGLRFMTILSLTLAVYIAWQLWPSEGPLGSILWGLGFGGAIWAVFGLSLAFNTFVRKKR